MSDRRAALLGGAVFVLVGVGAGPLLPPPPSGHPSAAHVADYFADHHSTVVAGSTLAAVAAVALLPLLVALGRSVGGAAGSSVRTGGGALVAIGVLGGVVQAGLAAHASDLDPSALLAAFTLERAVFYAGPALVVAGVALAAAAGASPTWHRALSALLGVVALAGGVVQLTSTSGAATGLGFAGFLLTVVWVAATMFVLWRARDADGTAKRAAPAVAAREPVASR
ncbi:MAG: hypothetical protein ACTHMS_15805 [Jatrophihabitans sp.]|uniref:hypothetical protein n=1 Tax=Jatrophihabitans sp. TaxID=1932789 RepID=UPI003F8048D4